MHHQSRQFARTAGTPRAKARAVYPPPSPAVRHDPEGFGTPCGTRSFGIIEIRSEKTLLPRSWRVFSLPGLKILRDHGPACHALLGAGGLSDGSATRGDPVAPKCRAAARKARPRESARCRAAKPALWVRSALLAYGAVYAFAQQVGVAVVARVLLDHVVQHPAQRHRPSPRIFLLPEQLEAGRRGHE